MSALAETESPQFFIGAKGGYQWAPDDSQQGAIWGAYGGLQFTPSLSWDLGYQHHETLSSNAISIETWLIESALRYDWYLQDNLSLYGRLGVARWDMDKRQPSLHSLEATGISPLGEVGMRYSFIPSLSLSVGYQYIDNIGASNTGKYDSNTVMASLSYTFGRKAQSAPEQTTATVESNSVSEDAVVGAPPQIFNTKTFRINFAVNSDTLSDGHAQQLDEVFSILNAYPQSEAIIVGYSDSSGSDEYNQTLSERRAQQVMNLLIDLGVSSDRLVVRAKGESNPVTSNSTVEGRANNRRVEIIIPNFQYN
ncbi:membrane protein [Vibrio zhanjiangensis]|uniref:Membrane protein n=2 Tax=Vibrio zhanjiangensis TaxID=1046128 RepID=A0ABQ6F2B9_9VIBR|nr:membrane protein [Vibrio zhanjiangensis]